MSEQKCEYCGVPWSDHLGLAGTCAQLADARADRDADRREHALDRKAFNAEFREKIAAMTAERDAAEHRLAAQRSKLNILTHESERE